MSYPDSYHQAGQWQEKACPLHCAACSFCLDMAADNSSSKKNCTMFEDGFSVGNQRQSESRHDRSRRSQEGADLKLLEALRLLRSAGLQETDRIYVDLLKEFEDILQILQADKQSVSSQYHDTFPDNEASFCTKNNLDDRITFGIPFWLDDLPILGQVARLLFYNFLNLVGFVTSTFSISKNALFGCHYHNKKDEGQK